jgi:hypothetical protein
MSKHFVLSRHKFDRENALATPEIDDSIAAILRIRQSC